jgi:hypothetical protein
MTARYPLVRVGADISELPAGDTLLGVSGGGSTDAVKMHRLIKNNTGITLLKGQAVYIDGATGVNVTVALAQANAESTSSKTLGLIEADILNGSTGYVVTEGELIDFDTSAATNEGDSVWLSPTIAGGLVYGLANKPVAPNHMVYLGVVSRKNVNNGVILVKVQNGYELNELHNVLAPTSGLANNDILTWEASSSLWKNKQLAGTQVTTALGFTPYNSTNPSGYTSNLGTVTSVSGTGTVSGLTLTGDVTSSGSLTLGGTLAVGLSDISGLGTNVSTFLATPTAANLAATVTDETGTGALVFGTTPTITALREVGIALATGVNLDLAAGNFFSKTVTANTNFTVSNIPTTGIVPTIVLDIINGGAFTIGFWSNLRWASGVAPVLTVSGKDSLGFYTTDGGLNWIGLILGKDLR